MTSCPTDAALRRRLRLGTVGLGVAVAALSGAVVTNPDVLTATSRRAVEATATAYDTTPAVAFVTLHAPLVFGVLAGAVGSVYVGLLLPSGVATSGEAAADPDSVAAAVRFYAATGAVATAFALGPPLAVVVGVGPLPAGLLLAFVAGLPVGVLALCGATVGTALRAKTGWRSAALLGTAGPVVGLVLAHAAPTGPVWTVTAGTVFVAAALVGGGWTLVRGPRS
ncbi:hypothetical protein [Salinigranum marinum]|uniref:hypothetical protein n=1 Tax=Salinigranum marinum TaxID=1515595 RepID=UPI002989BA2C|nr:hypothetical protein [Salinigranum marinum]